MNLELMENEVLRVLVDDEYWVTSRKQQGIDWAALFGLNRART